MQCLLPLANTPMIEYTFDLLANAGVQDIFVYCGAHTALVEEYIRCVCPHTLNPRPEGSR